MTDITKCAAADQCPKKKYCYRATAPDGQQQSYFMPEKIGHECEDWVGNEQYDVLEYLVERDRA